MLWTTKFFSDRFIVLFKTNLRDRRLAKHRKTTEYHHGNLREACIKEGIKLLHKRGADKLSLRDIARRLKVSPGAPYRHFANKQDLLAAIATWGFDEFAKYLQSYPKDAVREHHRFRSMGHSFLDFAKDHPDVFRLMFSGKIDDFLAYPELRAAGEKAFAVLYNCIARGREAGEFIDVDCNRISVHAFAMMHGYCTLLLNNRLQSANINDHTAHALLDGMTDDMMFGVLSETMKKQL